MSTSILIAAAIAAGVLIALIRYVLTRIDPPSKRTTTPVVMHAGDPELSGRKQVPRVASKYSPSWSCLKKHTKKVA